MTRFYTHGHRFCFILPLRYCSDLWKGLGRTALIGSLLGIVCGAHCILGAQLFLCVMGVLPYPYNQSRSERSEAVESTQKHQQLIMLLQWCTYVISFCSFHLGEFFVTAIYNPTQATADSYLINHSMTYTAAAISSWIEFWLRFVLLRYISWISLSPWVSFVGFFVLITAQMIRSIAMATAAESFNHLIQTSKKQNHVLVTHGIYSIFRHPSYVGFFYWSIGTQLLLGNIIHLILYTGAAWIFFQRRIHYEEESLCQFFPATYPEYASHTYMGIPFLKSRISRTKEASTKNVD
jgi:protein-S-isoprenylcysteine O-methyltransferase